LASSVTEGIVSVNDRTVSEGNGVVLPNRVADERGHQSRHQWRWPGQAERGGDRHSHHGSSRPTARRWCPPRIGFAVPSITAKLIADQLSLQGVTNSGRAAPGIQAAQVSDSSGLQADVAVVAVTSRRPADKAA